jgi:hypothetical protein
VRPRCAVRRAVEPTARSPLRAVRARPDGRFGARGEAVLLAEDKVEVVPLGPGCDPFGDLGCPVCAQCVAELTRERNCSATCPRLRLYEDQALARLPLQGLANRQ